MSGNYEALTRSAIGCEKPAYADIRPWGEEGSSYSCYVRNGPFVAAENGYVRLRGQYEAGKETGVWLWYDQNGRVVKEVDYAAGLSK